MISYTYVLTALIHSTRDRGVVSVLAVNRKTATTNYYTVTIVWHTQLLFKQNVFKKKKKIRVCRSKWDVWNFDS